MSATTDAAEADGSGSIMSGSKLAWPDLVVIVLYLSFVIGVGIWSSRRSRKNVSGYFLASRSMHWIPVGASLFASNVGAAHFVGLPGSGAASGIGVAGYELFAIFELLLLGWVFVPVYMGSGIYTMPEYLRERFGGQRIRIYLSFLSLLIYIFTKISVDLFAGALFIQLALNKSSPEWLYISILILLAIAALFTICGGLTAVMWTDLVQTVLMITGSFVLMIITFNRVGSLETIVEEYPYAVASVQAKDLANNSCGEPPSDYMNLLRSSTPGVSDLPWTGMIFGQTINAIWYMCTDQVIVQRGLASKNLTHAKAGSVLAGWLKFMPLWLLVFPGMAARVLFPERVACADPEECTKICGSPKGCSNIAYGELILELLPTGLAGMMLGSIFAALLSSLTSIFNSASTIFTIDVWSKFRSKASDGEKIIVGRCFVVVLVVISVIWIPVIQNSGSSQLFEYINSIASFLAPPICAVFLLAIFWDRTNEQGAFWGLMVGLVVGVFRFIVEFSFQVPICGSGLPDPRPHLVKVLVGNVHYLHFSCFLWLITLAVTIGVSLLTPPIPSDHLYRLTWASRKDPRVRKRLHRHDHTEGEVAPTTEQLDTTGVQNAAAESRASGLLRSLCGTEAPPASPSDVTVSPLTEEQKAKDAADFLEEDPFWKDVVTVHLVVCVTATVFVVGFYA